MRMIKIKSIKQKSDKVDRDDKNKINENDKIRLMKMIKSIEMIKIKSIKMIKIKLIEVVKTHKVNKTVCFYFSSIVIGVASTLSFFKNKKTHY